MIPTGAFIPQGVLVRATLDTTLGPLGACLLVAVPAVLVWLVGVLIRPPRAHRTGERAVPPRPAPMPDDTDLRRPAA